MEFHSDLTFSENVRSLQSHNESIELKTTRALTRGAKTYQTDIYGKDTVFRTEQKANALCFKKCSDGQFRYRKDTSEVMRKSFIL